MTPLFEPPYLSGIESQKESLLTPVYYLFLLSCTLHMLSFKLKLTLFHSNRHFRPRPAIKGQAVADFVAELTPPMLVAEQVSVNVTELQVSSSEDEEPTWTLYVDGSSNSKGCGAGLLLVSPDGERFEYALRFTFRTSNNEAEYEALIAGLRVAERVGVTNLLIFSDSQLIVNQVAEMYQAKEHRMATYLMKVKELLKSFSKYEIRQIPRSQNANADSLARLAAAYDTELCRTVPVEILTEPSILEKEVVAIGDPIQGSQKTWMDPLIDYLVNGTVPSDKASARRLRYRAARYAVRDNRLYKRSYSIPLLKCLTHEEAKYVMREVHEGVCGNH